MTKDKLMKMIDAYAEGKLIRDWVESAVDQYSESLAAAKPLVSGSLELLQQELNSINEAMRTDNVEIGERMARFSYRRDIEDAIRLIKELSANDR